MRHLKTLADRQADKLKAKAKLAERLSQRTQNRRPSLDLISPQEPSTVSAHKSPTTAVKSSWKEARALSPAFRYYSSFHEAEVFLQPWVKALLNIVLEAADRGGISLCLLWPAEFNQPALLHGLCNLQRNRAGDLKGLRTLLYPGSHTSRLALQAICVDREELISIYRAGWTTNVDGTTFNAATRSIAYEALLGALNDIEIWNNVAVDPPLGALIPCFVYDSNHHEWLSSARNQLENAICKVYRRANRQDAREKIALEWTNPAIAPGAFMVMHNSTTKKAWKQALTANTLQAESRPDLILLDATMAAMKSTPNAMHRIVEFIKTSSEVGLEGCGKVAVSDDPRVYLMLRARLAELRLPFQEHVWVAESDHAVYSETPHPDDWRPIVRSNANCHIGIVDRDASVLAARFRRLAFEVGGDEHLGNRLLMEACFFVLRISNMPAGMRDLADELAERTSDPLNKAKYSWSEVVTKLHSAIESGVLSAKCLQVERVIEQAQSLITNWRDSTPMAEKLLADVQTHTKKSRDSIVIVLQSPDYVSVARRFLQRRLGQDWVGIEHRVEWHSLSNLTFNLNEKCESNRQHYIIVGFNQHVMRLLLTCPDLPNGTNVLLSYKQAEGALRTLTGMKKIEAFKPYRGRIGLLVQELERRLNEMPSLPDLSKLAEFSMTFDLSDTRKPVAGGEQASYRFDLDGSDSMYASGWVYRYDIGERPEFHRVPAKEIVVGDLVFEMGDELRLKLEDVLHLNGNNSDGTDYPQRNLLKLYHDDVQARCAQFFPEASNRAALARHILQQMVAENAEAVECRPERIQYWLAVGDHDDKRPHAPKELKYFRMFCHALNISQEQADDHWKYVRSARLLNQNLGRELAARYAEILFHPETAIAYRKVPPTVIRALQAEAVQSVFRVMHIVPPSDAIHKVK